MANDDVDIVRRVIAGQLNDYRVLVERHQDAIYRFVRSMVSHRHETEDITQEVFLAAYKNLARFDDRRAKFSTWLFTIARNRAINHLRRHRERSAHESMAEPVDTSRAVDAVVENEFLERLDRSLNALSVDQKTVFVLAEIEELSHAEIAEIERISIGTVKSRLHRAKKRLRAHLGTFVRET